MTSRYHDITVSLALVSCATALLLVAGIGPAQARQQMPPPRVVPIQSTVSQQRFRQAVQQSQTRDQIRKNQVEHNIRQQSLEQTRRPATSTNPNDNQVDKAQNAQDALYQARQRDQVQRYNDALTPQPVPAATVERSDAGDGKDKHGH